jgi:hypothetical protein
MDNVQNCDSYINVQYHRHKHLYILGSLSSVHVFLLLAAISSSNPIKLSLCQFVGRRLLAEHSCILKLSASIGHIGDWGYRSVVLGVGTRWLLVVSSSARSPSPPEESQVAILYNGWAPGPVWTLSSWHKSFASSGNQHFPRLNVMWRWETGSVNLAYWRWWLR